jgi:predicted amidohydrolase
MLVGLYQNNPIFGEIQGNIETAADSVSAVKADLIVLPELFNTGYQFTSREEAESLAEEIPGGNTCQLMIKLAVTNNVFLVFGMAERFEKKIYNSAAVVGPEGLLGVYRKTHLFFEEKLFFEPGNSGFKVFKAGRARIGVMICFDWIFPESARILALMGAQIICHPSNLVLPHCQAAMVTRSLENGIFSITANRVGMESRAGKDPLVFTGMSQILDTRGKLLRQIGTSDTGIIITEIDPSQADKKNITRHNDLLSDRRTELYAPLVDHR